MKRNPDSHKGDNGKVLVIGGSSRYYGAAILCALGAEYSGVDLVFPFMPPQHLDAAKTYSLNFILHGFHGENLTSADVDNILEAEKEVDSVVIGPGLGTNKETDKAIRELFKKIKKPTVVDASALMFTNNLPREAILTPHRGEFTTITGDEPTEANVQKWAKDLGVTILCKGPSDIIANKDEIVVNDTGNAKMTVGGTGDVLSGCVAGLVARGFSFMDACHTAAEAVGIAGEQLGHSQASFTAHDLAQFIPRMLHHLHSDE